MRLNEISEDALIEVSRAQRVALKTITTTGEAK